MKNHVIEKFDLSGDTAVSVKELNLYYGNFHALKSIYLDFPKNRLTALIGPSGCGKSTLLKSLNRMNDLVEGCKITGEVKVGDTDIYAKNTDLARLRKNVGMVFQRPNPLAMSVYDNIAYGPRTFGIKARSVLDGIVEESLKGAAMWDEMKDRLNKSALGLSGGSNAGEKRKALLKKLNLPEHMSANAMLQALNLLYTREELEQMLNESGIECD